MFETIKKQKLQTLLLFPAVFFGLLWLSTLPFREHHFDDAWFGEEAWQLVQHSKVCSHVFCEMLNWHKQMFVFQKLLVYVGAIFIKIFGFGIFTVKSVSLLCFTITIVTGYYYFKKDTEHQVKFLIFFCLIMSNALMVEFSFVYRPEMMVAMFGFLSFFLLHKSINGNNKNTHLILSAICTGLAATAHLNGLLFMAAGFVALLISKYFRSAFLFGTVCFFSLGFYFVDIMIFEGFDEFIYQFTNDPATKGKFNISSRLLNLVNEHRRLFHSPPEIAFTVLAVVLIGFNFKKLKKDRLFELSYAILCSIFLSLISRTHTWFYLVTIMPPYFVLLTYCISYRTESKRSAAVINSLVVICTVLAMTKSIPMVCTKEHLEKENKELASHFVQTTNAKALVPFSFIFNQIEKHQLTVLPYYIMYEGYHNEKLTAETYEKSLLNLNIQYVIYDKRREFEIFEFKKTDSAFEKIYETEKYIMYSLKSQK